jgi:hypothetical protein
VPHAKRPAQGAKTYCPSLRPGVYFLQDGEFRPSGDVFWSDKKKTTWNGLQIPRGLKGRSAGSRALPLLTALLAASASAAGPAAAETRGFVVSLMYPASYSKDGDCSRGINPPVAVQVVKNLLQAGWTQERIDALRETGGENALAREDQYRGRINGRPTNTLVNPQSVPDPNLSMVDNTKYALGFDLDGNGAGDPDGFEDPFTGEKGVDNQVFRAMGCFTVFRGDDKIVPGAHEQAWTLPNRSMPAMLVTLEGDDLSKDGPLTVTFDMAFERIETDAQGKVLAGMTFRVDPDPANHHVIEAVQKDGVITVTKPGRIFAKWGEPQLQPYLDLKNVKLRLQQQPDGRLRGMVGGYMPYIDLLSEGLQANGGTDKTGLYWNLRKAADSNPDPKTGRNRDISATWMLEAVPALPVKFERENRIARR